MAGLVGLLVLVGLPIAALLSILTIIGVPLGLLLLFGLLLLLMLGMATAALFLGDAALARMSPARAGATGWRLLLLLLALLLFWVVAQLPAIGRLAVFLLLLAGTGAFARQILGMGAGGSRAEPQPRPSLNPPAAGAVPLARRRLTAAFRPVAQPHGQAALGVALQALDLRERDQRIAVHAHEIRCELVL